MAWKVELDPAAILHQINHALKKYTFAMVAHKLATRRRLQRWRQIRHYEHFFDYKRDVEFVARSKGSMNPADYMVRVMTADGELYIFPEGHRLLFPRSRK